MANWNTQFLPKGMAVCTGQYWHSRFLSPLLASFFAFPVSLAAPGWPCNLVLANRLLGKTYLLFLCWLLPGLYEDVMSGVTAAVLGHEVSSVKEKADMRRLKE